MLFKSRYYQPGSDKPFKISRSKIDLFVECERCFYLDRRLGIPRPSMPGFSLNSAVDTLLKNEFDILRKEKKPHALMKKYGIEAIPFSHPDLPKWRGDVNRFSGAAVLHKRTNLIVDGLIDDLWIDKKGEIVIVDYKSTSTEKEISLEDKYKQGYKRQVEVYQWIFRQMNFAVSKKAYFVFANAIRNNPRFDGILSFKLSIVPYVGDDRWVEDCLDRIKKTLEGDKVPQAGKDCEHCLFTSRQSRLS